MFISFAELSNRMSRYSKCMLMLVKFSGKRKSDKSINEVQCSDDSSSSARLRGCSRIENSRVLF